MYAIGNVHVELSEDNVTIPIEINGVVDTDYNDFIEVKISLYDNGNLINNDEITYSAIINGDSDSKINQVFDAKPTNTITAGFFGNSLYIGRDYINRWSSVSKLRVECQIKYKDVLYTKTFVINKSTNAYEMQTSQDVIYIDNFGNVKTSDIRVKILKWMENSFNAHGSGYLD
jgi:hypothetical protein